MRMTVGIKGMHCESCVERLTAAFGQVPGVRSATVSLSPPRAEIETSGPVAIEDLAAAARRAGDYSISPGTAPGVVPGEHAGHAQEAAAATGPRPSLYPLFLIVAFIAGTVLLAHLGRGPWSWHEAVND